MGGWLGYILNNLGIPSGFVPPVVTPGVVTSTTIQASATAATGGQGAVTYQWYASTINGFTPGAGNLVAGQTSLTLHLAALTAATVYYLRLVATDSTTPTPLTATSAQTQATTLSMTPFSASTIAIGTIDAASIMAAAPAFTGGLPPYTYQWYGSTVGGFTYGPATLIPAATGLGLTWRGLTKRTLYFLQLVGTDSASTVVATLQAAVVTASHDPGFVTPLPAPVSGHFDPSTLWIYIPVQGAYVVSINGGLVNATPSVDDPAAVLLDVRLYRVVPGPSNSVHVVPL